MGGVLLGECRLRFESLVQGSVFVTEYEARFCELSRHALTIVSDEAERVHRFMRGLNFSFKSCVFMATREGDSFRPNVSTTKKAELMVLEEVGEPKKVRSSSLFSCTSSRGRGSHRGSGSFQRRGLVHVSIKDASVEPLPMDSVLVVQEFIDVFPTDLPSFSLDKDIEFAINFETGLFIDDILVYYKTEEYRNHHLRILLQRLKEEKFYAKSSKYEFWLDSVALLGHMVSKEGIWERFQKLKTLLDSALVLTLPDEGVDFTDYCDASGVGLGDVLMLKVKVIAYVSWQLKTHEMNYLTHDLDVAVVVFMLKLWRHYLYGVHCEVLNDHRSLQYSYNQGDLNFRYRRWLELLNDYDSTILYHPGKDNVVADAFSKNTTSIGSLATISVEEKPLARDVHRLGNSLVHLQIYEEKGGLITLIEAHSSLFDQIYERQFDDKKLYLI
ncbi:hypothetical protein MTR67_034747 [Solanum verrucosum]|uniref:Reverse transcriptase RNase H-like domain-containing protein n=1 Tax=Solanum verrucosum TaxID=315347 RepID=A0AAF0U8N0_SOLVR|nr:hypothetical protein MTR67_034747 [Solanum verrucosum]